MKENSKSLIIFSVCLLILLLGCHKKPPPPDYVNQSNCQSKRAAIDIFINPNNSQLEVLNLIPDGAAEKADIRAGDIIVSINDKQVKTKADFRAIMSTVREAIPVSIVVKRNSESITKTVLPAMKGYYYTADAILNILENDKKIHLIIVVGEITNNTVQNSNYAQHEEWKKSMAVQLRSYVEVGLTKNYQGNSNFSIVTRESLDRLIQELQIQQSGLVTELIKSGKILGATHMLVIDFNRYRTADWSTKDITSRRLIEIERGKTIAAESCQYIYW